MWPPWRPICAPRPARCSTRRLATERENAQAPDRLRSCGARFGDVHVAEDPVERERGRAVDAIEHRADLVHGVDLVAHHQQALEAAGALEQAGGAVVRIER